ncbi:MAG: hypothetical protein KGK00_07795 [Paracoccaceae bacterium]|nr:hypothetical protein [Paracoccaceae bacterium]
MTIFRDRPFVTYESGQTVRVRAAVYLERRIGCAPRISTTASGSTSVTRLVEAGLGYGVVPEWSVPDGHAKVTKFVLTEMEPMKLWFAHTVFLGSNDYIRRLRDICEQALG